MHDVWYKEHVTLAATSTTVLTERLLKSELYQQMFQVMDRVRVRSVPHSRALLKVRIVST